MRGILNINKESGITSFDVVSRLRRILHEKRIGHGGTLDPLADGVLPIFVGQATRVSEYMLEHPKTYCAVIRLGSESDTYDAEGVISQVRDPGYVTQEMVTDALQGFVGNIMQIPPVYSAIKKNGQTAYKSARNGESLELEARPVTVYSCDQVSFDDPQVTIRVRCARGTYIRSIAHDLGKVLGCGGYIERLTREQYGPFSIRDAVSLRELEELMDKNEDIPLFGMDYIMQDWDRIDVSDDAAKDLINGKTVSCESCASRIVVYHGGSFLAVCDRIADGLFHPSKVFL